MNHPYKTRERGATVTVFVPYDCKNHCPFCINKEEYADMTGFSLEKICESIGRMDNISPRCEFVFTGGEPFANLEAFQIMMDAVPPTHKIYINTTLPVSTDQPEETVLDFIERNMRKIACINVSRHLQHYVVESNDSLLAKLIVYAPTRLEAIRRMRRALEELVIEGPATNTDLLHQILHHPDFVRGNYSTGFLEAHMDTLLAWSGSGEVREV